MGDDTPTITPEPIEAPSDTTPATEPTLPELTRQFAELLAFEGLAKDYITERRAALFGRMLDKYHDEGADRFNVVPEGGGAALVSFTLRK